MHRRYFYWSRSCSVSEKIISSDVFLPFYYQQQSIVGNFLRDFPAQSPSQCISIQLIKTYELQHPFGISFPLQGGDWFSKRNDGYISHKTRPLINCLLPLTGAAKDLDGF